MATGTLLHVRGRAAVYPYGGLPAAYRRGRRHRARWADGGDEADQDVHREGRRRDPLRGPKGILSLLLLLL